MTKKTVPLEGLKSALFLVAESDLTQYTTLEDAAADLFNWTDGDPSDVENYVLLEVVTVFRPKHKGLEFVAK